MDASDIKAATGRTRVSSITMKERERSGLHCYECLRTYFLEEQHGSENLEKAPRVCTRCYDELASGESVWVQEAPWSQGRVVRR